VNGSRRLKRVRERERGNTLLEYAIVVIVLLMFLFGIIDFGRALYAYHFVANAAREGTRFAIVRGSSADCTGMAGCPADNDSIQDYVQNMATGIGLNNASSITAAIASETPANSGLTCTATPIQPGCIAQVTVQYPFKFIFPFLPKATCRINSVSASICMTSTSEMVVSQ
jgi:Flp pilus assembly protein TadG